METDSYPGKIDYFCHIQLTGVAQLVEHRSPKPSVGRSSRSSRASRMFAAFFLPIPDTLPLQVVNCLYGLMFGAQKWILSIYHFLCTKDWDESRLVYTMFY